MKYDGERKSKIFTVMIIDKNDFRNTLSLNFHIAKQLIN